jgi:DNA-binding NtrC family response regulator
MLLKRRLLIVDDDAELIQMIFENSLKDLKEFDIKAVTTIDSSIDAISKESFDVVLLDLHFNNGDEDAQDGFDAIPQIRHQLPNTYILVHSNDDDDRTIAKALALGANNFIVKHRLSPAGLVAKLKETLRRMSMTQDSYREGGELAQVVGAVFASQAMSHVFSLAANARRNTGNVLIQGPTGSGKELVAAAIGCTLGKRPYVAVNCAALTDTLIESELFGHDKGSFTGAHARSIGKFEAANSGTLFLDEVGCLSKKAQEVLLRVLQSGEFMRIGSSQTIKVNVRVICATNDDLKGKMDRDEFRADLYERLAVHKISVPSLGERPEDIEPLVAHFLKKRSMTIDPTCLAYLRKLPWPRNVRELENTITHMINHACGNELDIADLPRLLNPSLAPNIQPIHGKAELLESGSSRMQLKDKHFIFQQSYGHALDDVLQRCAAAYILSTAQRLGENPSLRALAEQLQIPHPTLHRRLSKYGITLEKAVGLTFVKLPPASEG